MSEKERKLQGPRHVLSLDDERFPSQLFCLDDIPEHLYVIGDPLALEEGLAIVGARNATPYGQGCAKRFARCAAERGVVIVSGGARGCDSAAHTGAMDAGGKTVVVCGFGCDWVYPAANFKLFQRVIDSGGAVISEYPWEMHAQPFMFRERNRIIAGLSRATLVVEAGLPSGTFSTADAALAAGREVWAVPGSITSPKSKGANRLIFQGGTPIVDDDSFNDMITATFDVMRFGPDDTAEKKAKAAYMASDTKFQPILDALLAEAMDLDDILCLAARNNPRMPEGERRAYVMDGLFEAEERHVLVRYGDGRYGARTDFYLP